jgi:large conductance mechanosensitive channel
MGRPYRARQRDARGPRPGTLTACPSVRQAAAMKTLLKEFKAFASGGNLIDLAIGFVIAAAFIKVVESFAENVLGGLIGAVFGEPSFDDLAFDLGDGTIGYGVFLTALVNFVIVAACLFGIVKFLKRVGLGNFRAQGQRECPWCREFVAVDAVKCKWCTADLPAVIDADEGADERIVPHHTH